MQNIIKHYKDSLTNSNLEKDTITKYVRQVECMLYFIGDISNINSDSLSLYKEHLLNKVTVNTYNIKAILINKFLKFANINESMKLVKRQKRTALEDVPTETDYLKLINKIRKVGDVQIECILLTLTHTGIRISELQHITVESLRKGHVTILSKGKERTIILPSKLVGRLQYYANSISLKSGSIFLTEKGNPQNTNWIRVKLKQYARSARIKADKVYPHNFRHFYAKKFLSKGGDVTLLKDLLGHSTLDTTAIYLQNSLSEQKSIVNKIFS